MQIAEGSKPPEFLLNGRAAVIRGISTQTTLLDFLRARGLTGAKEGCAEGECGACTVMMVGESRDGGSDYQAVNSCLMFLPMAAGQREFYTVEALARDGELCEAQRAIAAAGGSQCGYCTPGFVMSLFAEQYRPGREGPCDPMRSAAICAAARAIGRFAMRRCHWDRHLRAFLRTIGCRSRAAMESVIYRRMARFERPATLEECLAIAARDSEANSIAGAPICGRIQPSGSTMAEPDQCGRRRGAERFRGNDGRRSHRRGLTLA